MKRRSFVQKSILTGLAAITAPVLTQAMPSNHKPQDSEYYELRVYSFKDATQKQLVEKFYQTIIPIYNRLGVQNVGVFNQLTPADPYQLYVILPYKSLDHYEEVAAKLETDAAYKKEGDFYLNAPATAPAYERIESSLMKAFKNAPKMIVPGKQARIFELRQYQSATEAASKKKISMFNEEAEIEIFKRLNFKPVFWGETIIGGQRPNLTYMVTFDDLAAKDAHWKSFGADAEWKRISSMPEYADALIISKIVSTLLTPTAFSQV
jgi:hypothetical protein